MASPLAAKLSLPRRLILIAFVALAVAPSATAKPHGLTLGFYGDSSLTGPSASSRAMWIPRAAAEGAGMVRVNIDWAQVAPATRPAGFNPSDPASPGYNWSATDATVRDLSAAGIKVLISITYAPSWAEGPGMPASEQPGSWEPDPTQFAAFARAAATRYSGHFSTLPRVRYWQPWNEPNLDYYLSPQWVRAGGRWQLNAPAMYRSLLNAFYGAVKSVSRSNTVVMGGTAPYGDPVGSDPVGSERIPPVTFDRALFCLTSTGRVRPVACPDPAHFDAFDHHPYGIGGPNWHAINPTDVAVPDLGKLTGVLHAAQRAHRVLPRGRKQLWITEVSWDSNPPDPGGVPIQRQARWLEQALYVLWRQGASTILWAIMVDQPCVPNCADTSQAGLFYDTGSSKPATVAFRFPFVTQRLSHRTVLVWGRSPVTGELSVQAMRHGRWRTIKHLAAHARGVFAVPIRLRGKATLRATVGGMDSLTWSQRG